MMISAYDLLDYAQGHSGKAVEGLWQSIQLRPDFASTELINIGVRFQSEAESRFRLLNSFDKFSHLYGGAAEDELRFVTSALGASLSKGFSQSPFPSVEFGETKFARGESADEIVERLFRSTVSFDGPIHRPSRKARGKFVSNSVARDRVFQAMKVEGGLSAESILAEGGDLLFQANSKVVALDIPLQPSGRLGTLVSAAFSKTDSVERVLLRGYLDLTTAMALRGIHCSGFFIYRPSEVVSEFQRKQVDNVIDLVEWKLLRSGIRTQVSEDTNLLAQGILEWAS
jgi:hypothetical protein